MKKFRLAVVVFISLLLLAIAGLIIYPMLGQWKAPAYAAGKSNLVRVYRLAESEDGGQTMEKAGTLVRGAEVTRYMKTKTVDGVTYCRITAEEGALTLAASKGTDESAAGSAKDAAESAAGNGQSTGADAGEEVAESAAGDEAGKDAAPDFDLYIPEESLADSAQACVLESDVYVRTPATVYKNADGPDIASFAPKGTHLTVTGYDKLLDNGYINKYKVEFADVNGKTAEGYVYGKYTVDTQKKADKVYNEHGEYDAAKKDVFGYELYGGKAKNLDYYPYERTKIEGNEFCDDARTMYLNGAAAVNPDVYVKIIEDTDCNAVVMDLKDGYLAYQSEVAKELSPTSYKGAYATVEDYRKGVEKLRKTGVYLIGRIVVFNDPQFAKDHPECCIKYGGKTSWPSGFSRGVWEYNVKLAQEAVKEFGFNEIQFDYVRFPESTYEMSKSGKANFRNTYKEEKAQAIQNFCFYATDQLREAGAYTSVDVFGESAYSYVTAYGQYWMAISNIVDAISAMPYTDHFSGEKPWEDPYGSVLNWAKRAAKQQKRLQDPAAARTWITGYNTPYWAPTVNYNAARLKDQIRALEKAGLKGGFIPWNALSDAGKYNQYRSIWNKK